MSENPYESNPESGDFDPPSRDTTRPVSVKVFGILNLVFAVMGICGIAVGSVMLFGNIIPQNPQMPNPTLDLMQNNQGYRLFTIVSMSLGFIFTVVLAVGGVGLLQWRRYGRTASIAYGWYAIVAPIVGLAANYFYVFGPMLEQMKQAQGAPAAPQQFAAIGGIVGGVIGALFGLIYPILLLVFMYRRKVMDALH